MSELREEIALLRRDLVDGSEKTQSCQAEVRVVRQAVEQSKAQAETALHRAEEAIQHSEAALHRAEEAVQNSGAYMQRTDAAAQRSEAALASAQSAEKASLQLRRMFFGQERRLAILLEQLRKSTSEPADASPTQIAESEQTHNLDNLHLVLEDELRGSREEIKERASIYVSYLQTAAIGGEEMPILDLGCGRGEWLEVARDHGLSVLGVDCNRTFVGLCRELGLNAAQSDAIGYLRQLPMQAKAQ